MGQDAPHKASAAPADQDSEHAARVAAALAIALRNIAIYPATHPRVAAAAASFVAHLGEGAENEKRRATTIGQRDDELFVDHVCVAAGDSQAGWLLQRLREVGLRGFTFEPDCTAEDVAEFALTLNRCRGSNATAFRSLWPAAHPRIRAHDLVYLGTFRELEDPPTGEADAATLANAPLDAAQRQLRFQVLEQFTRDGDVQRRLESIQRACGNGTEDQKEIDLFRAVTELLPADVAAHPEVAAEMFGRILAEVEAELPAVLRGGSRLDGGELLRTALRIARKYFQTAAPEQPIQRDLPSGRPEDAEIGPDLDLLLQELAALPDGKGARLPPADQLQPTSPKIARELFGILLHVFVNTTRDEVRAAARTRLVAAMRQLDPSRLPIVAAHLREDTPGALAPGVRAQLIDILVEAGQAQLVRDYGYVDAAFVTRCYPGSLGIAARVLTGRPEDLAVFRAGLAALAPLFAAGGAEDAGRAGVLRDPAVVDALLRVGGPVAAPLLTAAAPDSPPEVRERLVAFARQLELPSPERTLLEVVQPAADVPAAYLARLLAAAGRRSFDASLRSATAEVLRDYVTNGLDALPVDVLADAIRALQYVPDAATEALLGGLARRGRFTQFGAGARAIRRAAREALDALGPGGL